MDDSIRLQAELANAEHRIATLERELNSLSNLLHGTERQVVQTPSGVEGFNNQWMVPAMPLGTVPSEEDGTPLPFSASYNEQSGEMTVSGGYWQEGATGEWQPVSPTTAFGTYVYLNITQEEDGTVVNAVLNVTSEAEADVLDLQPGADPDVLYPQHAYVLLAQWSGSTLIQRRHGNFTLGLWQIDGVVTRWPETLAGSPYVPPPA
jgi:hypothetical protein